MMFFDLNRKPFVAKFPVVRPVGFNGMDIYQPSFELCK
jgi:hypothetical protein